MRDRVLAIGGPRVDDFAALDSETQTLAERITVRTDDALQESEFALLAGDEELARVDAARGSPQHPLCPSELQDKVHDLAGDRFDDLADDEPAAELISRI